MKILLTKDVENLGQAGDVVEVAPGYGRNYLIPQELAMLATPSALQQADLHRRRAAERRRRIAAEFDALVDEISRVTLNFKAKAGETGRLYGSVTTAEIAEELSKAVEKEVDRRKIDLDSSIKDLGTHEVSLRLDADHVATFQVVVEPIEPDQEEEAAATTEEVAATVEEAAATTEEAAATVEEVAATVEEAAATVEEVAATAEKVVEGAVAQAESLAEEEASTEAD